MAFATMNTIAQKLPNELLEIMIEAGVDETPLDINMEGYDFCTPIITKSPEPLQLQFMQVNKSFNTELKKTFPPRLSGNLNIKLIQHAKLNPKPRVLPSMALRSSPWVTNDIKKVTFIHQMNLKKFDHTAQYSRWLDFLPNVKEVCFNFDFYSAQKGVVYQNWDIMHMASVVYINHGFKVFAISVAQILGKVEKLTFCCSTKHFFNPTVDDSKPVQVFAEVLSADLLRHDGHLICKKWYVDSDGISHALQGEILERWDGARSNIETIAHCLWCYCGGGQNVAIVKEEKN